MAELATLARPYAKAAFDFAQAANIVPAWHSALRSVSNVVMDPALAAYLNRPALSDQQKVEAVIAATDVKFSAAFRNFLALLSENDRLMLLPTILAEFSQLKLQSSGETNVVIESAYPLEPSQESSISSGLEKRFGTKINTTVVVRPELIAGVVIRAGDQVIDDSALGKLEKMRIRLSA